MRNPARWWLATVLAGVVWAAAHAQGVGVRWDGKEVRVATTDLHFLTGRVLERLRNGAAVALNFQLTVSAGVRVLRRTAERFVISYDLWEERFLVTRTSGTRRATSHLTQQAAEAWCLEQTALSTESLPQDRPLLMRVDVRAEELKNPSGADTEQGLSLTALIEVFSRPARTDEQSWHREVGPFRLEGVRQNGK